jgi:replicative DNA helicase
MAKNKKSPPVHASGNASDPEPDPVSVPAEIDLFQQFVEEAILDEERILANLAFDPVVAGKQLQGKHFGLLDFQGLEGNRILLGCMLSCLEDGETLNLPNIIQRLNIEQKNGKPKIDLVGGRDRVYKLFSSPFAKIGVSLIEDLDPVMDRIRDRNIRGQSRRLLTQFSEKLNRMDVDAFETLSGCIQELRSIFLSGSAGYIRNLDGHLGEMRELIAENKNRRRGYVGYETSFPLLEERLNGIQKDFYLLTGGVGMGKSTFITQLAWDLATHNPELTVLYFSLDLNRLDVTAKLVAQTAEIPIDFVKNPYVTDTGFEAKRQAGLARVSQMSDRLFVIDESGGRIFVEDIKKLVKRTRLERSTEVAVVIDPIFKIHLKNDRLTFAEKCNFLSAELKSLAIAEGVPVIATAGLPKAISNRRPVREDLEEIMGLLYDPYVVFFIYCDYLNDFETPFLEWQWGDDNFLIPISEIYIAKNKMGSVNTHIFYRYFEHYAKFRECAPQEVENYSAMIENLKKFKEHKNQKERQEMLQRKGRGEEF